MLTLFLFAVFMMCVAMLWNEGLWSNAITLVNITLAVLIATNYFEPLADFIEPFAPDYTYLWDFIALWGLFALSMGILRLVTDLISRHRVRFKMPVEHTGRVILAIWAGWMMVGFTIMSLHLAPLAAHPFGGGFQQKPMSGNFFGMAPDRQVMAFVQKSSRGALSRGHQGERPGYHLSSEDKESGCRVFDPQSDLVIKYRNRRYSFDKGRLAANASGVMYLRVPREKRTSGTGTLAKAPTVAGTTDLESRIKNLLDLQSQLISVLGKVTDADSAREVAPSMSRLADRYIELMKELDSLKEQRISVWEDERLTREYGDKMKNSARRLARELRRVADIEEAAEILEAPIKRMSDAAQEASKDSPDGG